MDLFDIKFDTSFIAVNDKEYACQIVRTPKGTRPASGSEMSDCMAEVQIFDGGAQSAVKNTGLLKNTNRSNFKLVK